MKKIMLVAVCLILAGLLAVNGTFAGTFGELFAYVTELAAPTPTQDPSFQVTLITPTDDKIQLNPGSSIDYVVSVSNQENSSPAYFRIAVAMQAAAFDHITPKLNTQDYQWSDWSDITIGGEDYKLIAGSYLKALPAGKPAPAAITNLSMVSILTNEQLAAIRPDFLKIKALAIRAEDFVDQETKNPFSAVDALNLALPLTNFNPF